MPTIVKVRNVLTAPLRSRPGAWLERCDVAHVVAVVLGEDALELRVRGHVEDEEAVGGLLLPDGDGRHQSVPIPRAPLRQRVDEALAGGWLPVVAAQLLHGVDEQSPGEPAVE